MGDSQIRNLNIEIRNNKNNNTIKPNEIQNSGKNTMSLDRRAGGTDLSHGGGLSRLQRILFAPVAALGARGNSPRRPQVAPVFTGLYMDKMVNSSHFTSVFVLAAVFGS